jgi:uncharacterized protein
MATNKRLVQEVGNWVSGERFWGREAELSHLCSLLREGASVSLTAPRRIGKTSLMREAGRLLADEFAVLHVDLQRARRAADMVVEFGLESRTHRDLWSRTQDVFRNVLGGIEELSYDELSIKFSDGLTGGWQRRAERLLAEFAAERPTIIFIDELPILVNRLLKGSDYQITAERVAVVDELLSWLRAAVIRHRGQVRFVIGGSISLGPILRQAKLSASINVFTPFDLEPWDPATALGALHALANNYGLGWGDGAAERVVEALGCCVPHHVQMFWAQLRHDAIKRKVFHIQVEDVERVFRVRLTSAQGQAELSHFEERLSQVLGRDLLPLTLDLLSEAAISDGLSRDAAVALCGDHEPARGLDAMREILDVLMHDGYLNLDDDGHYRFVSRLVHEWWRQRYRLSYVPLTARGAS